MSLDDRLAGLRDVPAPPLAGAAAARARGVQRTRRTRSALAGTAAVVAVVAVSAASALAGGADRTPAPPVASAAPAPSPVEPEVTQVPVPPFDPETGDLVAASLLTEQDVREAYPAATRVQVDAAQLVEPQPCSVPASTPLGVERSSAAFETPQGPVTSLVVAFEDQAAARLALTQLVDGVDACQGEAPTDPRVRQEVVSGLPGTGPDRVWVRYEDELPRLFAVLRVGRLLSVVQTVTQPEETTERAALLADRATERAAAEQPELSGDLSDVLLTPEEATAAESPGWQVDPSGTVDGPVLDPCGDGRIPRQEAVTGATGQVLSSRREVGGSSLVQEVFAFQTPRDAEAALGELADAVRRCPSAPVAQAPADHRVERSVVPLREGTFLVREVYCGPTCTDLYTTYALVARAGRLLSAARYAIAEDGDPGAAARGLLLATADRLARAELS